MEATYPFTIKNKWEVRNASNRSLWVPWAGFVWRKRAHVASPWFQPITAQYLDDWTNERSPLCLAGKILARWGDRTDIWLGRNVFSCLFWGWWSTVYFPSRSLALPRTLRWWRSTQRPPCSVKSLKLLRLQARVKRIWGASYLPGE